MTIVEKPAMVIPADWVPGPEQGCWTYDDLDNRKYRSLGIFSGQQTLPSQVVPGLPVRVEQFFV